MLDEMFGLKIHILGKTNEAKKLDLISQSHPENMHDTKNIWEQPKNDLVKEHY